jgi:uncharacterized membrane protein
MSKAEKPPYRFVASLVTLSLVGVLLLIARVIESDSLRYVFLFWNLMLAALPALLAWWLVQRIREHGWLRWQQLALTAVWVGFLPNSFYLVTDFIHLRQTYEASLLYDIAMLTSFIISGFVFGFIGLYLVHLELAKRLRPRNAWLIITGLLLASSFALYLGRFTRWNTWDVLFKPAGLLFDVSDRFINPSSHGQTYQTTIIFFVILVALYWVIWEAMQLMKRK